MQKKPNKKKRARFQALMQQAVQLHQRGNLLQARGLYENCLDIIPNHADALYYLGYLHHQANDNVSAESFLQRAVKAMPSNTVFMMGLSLVQEKLDKLSAAASTLKKVVKLQPDLAEAHNNYGVILRDLGNIDAAIQHLKQALELKPEYAEAHYNLGVSLADQGDQAGAEKAYRDALVSRPDYPNALRNLVELGVETEEITAQIQRLLVSNKTTVEEKITLHFAMGKILDKAQQHDEAFKHFEVGNKLKRSTISYDTAATKRYVDLCVRSFTKSLLSSFSTVGNHSEMPVFIVGMPRSGTTLIEQIISSHPLAHGAGELLLIRDIRLQIDTLLDSGKTFPENLSELGETNVSMLADQYLNAINELVEDNNISRVTDKMPTNFLYLGLLAILFPRARIIHCKRDPLDTCLSNYTQLYSRGNEFCYQLDELAEYYLEYQRLMQHWESIMPERILHLQYEDMVNDAASNVKLLLDFIGLPWNDNCLTFHNNQRAVQTASNWQVRQPVYKTSVKRWHNYREQLAPLIASLDRTVASA